MLNIGDVFSNLVGLFLLIAVGYAAVKLQVLPVSSTKLLSNLLMQITLPATILVSLVRPYDAAFIRDGVLIAILGTVLYLLYGLLSLPACRLFHVGEGRRGCMDFLRYVQQQWLYGLSRSPCSLSGRGVGSGGIPGYSL